MDGSIQEKLHEFATGLLEKLPHTPITAVGINPKAHYKVSSKAYWDKIGDTLAPKSIWSKVVEEPGLKSLTMQVKSEDAKDAVINVSIGPSDKIVPPDYGVVFSANCHFAISSEIGLGSANVAKCIIDENWACCSSFAKKVARTVFQEIQL